MPSAHQRVDLDDGEQYGEDDEQHDAAHHQDHHRFEQGQEDRKAALQALVELQFK